MNTVVELDLQLLSLLAGSVIPLLVAVFTKMNASSKTKAVVNLILSLAAGFVTWALEHNGRFTWYELVSAMALVYLSSGVTYQNFWKPTAVAPTVQYKTQAFGVGGTDYTEL